MSFAASLVAGRTVEQAVAAWLVRQGYCVLPAYAVADNAPHGPRVQTPGGPLIAPDMLCFNPTETLWVETKLKRGGFSWRRCEPYAGTWQTGIDLYCWRAYKALAACTPFPVWLMFVQADPIQGPEGPCPVGLFGGELGALQDARHHTSERYGGRGMIFFCVDDLVPLATLSEIGLDAPATDHVA